MKDHITSLSLDEIKLFLQNIGEKSFRAIQIFDGIVNGKNLSEISTISTSLKQELLKQFEDQTITIKTEIKGKSVTSKFIYELCDKSLIEGVLMEYKHGKTLCVSTQVGCRMGCKFCASGKDGLIRNLTAGEILSQVLVVNKHIGGTKGKREITNVVLMGSGEPLDNYDNVAKFLALVSSEEGLNVSQRNISLSTCGMPEGIKKLIDDGFGVNLTISLHAPTDEKRKEIMSVAHAYSISEVIGASKKYFEKTKRRIIFEYALIKNFNSSFEDAALLSKILKGLVCHVNLIPLNDSFDNGFCKAGRKESYAFCEKLNSLGISATVRRTLGDDIGGACGQLKSSYAGD